MKKRRMIAYTTGSALALALSSGGLIAADDQRPGQGPGAVGYQAKGAAHKPFMASRASEIIGMDVRGGQNDDFGEVEDLLIDPANGRVAAVLVASGGILGLGEKIHAVPPTAFSYLPPEKKLMLGLEKEGFRSASVFDATRMDDAQQLTSIYERHQQQPYWMDTARTEAGRQAVREADKTSDPQRASERARELTTDRTQTSAAFRLVKASDLIGENVENTAGDNLGEIEDLIVDLNSGRVVTAVVSAGGFLGIGDKLISIPLREFAIPAAGEDLVLNTSKEKLTGGPAFDRNTWPKLDDPAWVAPVYGYYGETMYWNPGADQTRQTVRDSDLDTTLTPQAAALLKKQAQETIKNDAALGAFSDRITVTVDDGKVTLKGEVDTVEQKMQIMERVKRLQGVKTVENHLTVKNK